MAIEIPEILFDENHKIEIDFEPNFVTYQMNEDDEEDIIKIVKKTLVISGSGKAMLNLSNLLNYFICEAHTYETEISLNQLSCISFSKYIKNIVIDPTKLISSEEGTIEELENGIFRWFPTLGDLHELSLSIFSLSYAEEGDHTHFYDDSDIELFVTVD